MKKTYETPNAEKIMFQYRDQVVAASGKCTSKWENIGDNGCPEDKQEWVEHVD